ncbi:MAG: tetratricopeptide repeat protein [Isosphaeraceae bacterium]
MSPIRNRWLVALLLVLATGIYARASDLPGGIACDPYVVFHASTRPRDLTREFVQRGPDFALENGGRRMSPSMPGFIYHGERIEGDRLLLENRHRSIRGWAPVSAVIPVTEADEFFSRAILQHPTDSFAYLMRGLARFEKTDCDHALADLNEALRLDPKNVAALITRAVLGLTKNRSDQALADANQAVELDPRNAFGDEQRAMIHASVKNDEAALRDFERALELGSR